MMATAAAAAAAERGGGPGPFPSGSSRPATADYSVLVVVGALQPAGLLERLLQQIDSGKFYQSYPVPESRKNRAEATVHRAGSESPPSK